MSIDAKVVNRSRELIMLKRAMQLSNLLFYDFLHFIELFFCAWYFPLSRCLDSYGETYRALGHDVLTLAISLGFL